MLRLKKIAITGGLSCGKSSVCRFLQELGAYALSADEIAHQLLSPDKHTGQKAIQLLGDEIVVDGKIDRGIVAKKVFNQKVLLTSLEKILHPAVLETIEKKYQQVKEQGRFPLFVVEIPLLFEVGGEDHFDSVIAVTCSPKIANERFRITTGYDDAEYEKRMACQLSAEEKANRADMIIENKGSLQDLYNECTKAYKLLIQ